jgi:geranylgeranyl pyrophosphate synthase
LRSAVFPAGKRVRAYLTMIAARLGGCSEEQTLKLACAIEFVHTCSLVLDDLPSMDDADLRRGRPALHLAFGEGTAILVATALLTRAYALFAQAAVAERLPRLIEEVSRCLGSDGMIAGQAAELAFSGDRRAPNMLASRDLKTSALMRLMLAAGAIAAGRPEAEIEALASFGEILGRVYQIHDDLADIVGDRLSTGKSVGQDTRHHRPSQARSTLLREVRPDELARRAAGMLKGAKAMLDRFGDPPEAASLRGAADFVLAQFDTVASRSASPA